MRTPARMLIAATVTGCCIQASVTGAQSRVGTSPRAPIHEVVETYGGHEVRDPYRYMEEGTPEALEWMRRQAAYTDTILTALPERNRLRDRIRERERQLGPRFQWLTRVPGELYLYTKSPPDADIYKLYARHGLRGKEHLLVDPEQYRTSGGLSASMQAFYQSRDGNLIAYTISIGNSERATLHVIDTNSGAEVEKPIENVLGFASVDWSETGRAFHYFRLPALGPGAPESDRYLNGAVYRHVIGTDVSEDRLLVGPSSEAPLRTNPRYWSSVEMPVGSHWALAVITDGVRSERMIYVAGQDELERGEVKWRKFVDFTDEVTDISVHENDVYVISQKNAPRGSVLRIPLNGGIEDAETIIPASAAAPVGIAAAHDAVYVVMRVGLSASLERIPYSTRKPDVLGLPIAGIPEISSTDPKLDGALFTVRGWTSAPVIYSLRNGKLRDTRLRPLSAAEKSTHLEVSQVDVKSHDGVKVPLTIVRKRGLHRDGNNMVLLEGYGAYGTAIDPFFDAFALAWYERGGTLAVAHVRGGGEFGEEWHRAGMKTTKPNTWRDFIACAEYLIEEKYTSPAHLAVRGVSAGGILIGRAITERPDLFSVALIGAGTTDMVHGELQKNGAVNIPEFGSVNNPDEFPALLEMSAYHHVKNGTRYPAVLLSTAWNDPVVDPWQPAKMAARLQTATSSGRPILLRVDDAGHDSWGSTRAQLYALRADQLAFTLWQLMLHQPSTDQERPIATAGR